MTPEGLVWVRTTIGGKFHTGLPWSGNDAFYRIRCTTTLSDGLMLASACEHLYQNLDPAPKKCKRCERWLQDNT